MPASLSGYVVKPIFPVATPSVDAAASQYPDCPFASLTSITPVIGQGFAVGAETRTGTEVDVGSVELEVGTMLARACMAAACWKRSQTPSTNKGQQTYGNVVG